MNDLRPDQISAKVLARSAFVILAFNIVASTLFLTDTQHVSYDLSYIELIDLIVPTRLGYLAYIGFVLYQLNSSFQASLRNSEIVSLIFFSLGITTASFLTIWALQPKTTYFSTGESVILDVSVLLLMFLTVLHLMVDRTQAVTGVSWRNALERHPASVWILKFAPVLVLIHIFVAFYYQFQREFEFSDVGSDPMLEIRGRLLIFTVGGFLIWVITRTRPGIWKCVLVISLFAFAVAGQLNSIFWRVLIIVFSIFLELTKGFGTTPAFMAIYLPFSTLADFVATLALVIVVQRYAERFRINLFENRK